MERRFTKHVFMTAWRRMSLALLVALCCHIAASAETLTVYNGTNTSNYLPVYGWGVDTQETTCEFVIPKGQLGAMEDGTISALTFYLSSNAAAAWNATIQVYLKEISATTLTGITGPDASTVVYTGTLDATGTEMTVTFSTPYTYNGGDLLIGTYVSEKSSNYDMTAFYGVTQSVNTACYKKSGSTTLQQFIPKTTFTYTPPSSVVPKPTNLAASNITYEKATITWSSDESGWNIAWSTNPDFDPASATTHADNVSVKTYTITGLSQLTDYYVAVQNAGSGKWSSTLHFKTAAQPTAVGDGWSDDFEGTNCGWDLINGELTNQWAWGTAANNGGTHALYISNDGGTTNAYSHSNTMVYAAKLLTFTEGTFDFSYDWKANGESNSDYMRVALIPATESLTAGTTVPTGFSVSTLPTGWIALDGGSKLNLETDWQSKVATIDVAAGNYYLVFAWRNDYATGTNPPAAIDNVSISKYPDEITDLAVSEVTTNSATVSWNGNGDSYNVRYRKQFLSEGFEGGSMPTGWTSEGDASWSVGTGDREENTGSHSGDKNAKITHTTKDHVTFLITPSMDLSGETSLTLSFWYINRAWGNDKDGFGVYYRVGTEGAWNELWSTTEAHGSWTNQEVTLTGLAANYQLGFKMTDGYGHGVGLDDIQIISADWQTVNNITDKSTTLTGLDANTTYGCQVQSVKAGKTSFWSPIATFTTMQLKNIANCTATVPDQTLGRFNPATNSYYKTGKISYLFGDWPALIGEEVIDGETKLTLGTDYEFGTISYASPDTRDYWDVAKDKVGDVCEVEIVGKGNYAGSTTATFTIVDPSGTWGDDNELSWSLNEGALSISLTTPANGNKAMKAADNYGKYPWNYYCSDVTSISIGDGITSIANYAFGSQESINTYSSVATVTLPSTLTSIGAEAFRGCSGATITIPTSVTTLGNDPFSNVAKVICTLNDNNSDFYSKLTTATSAEITYKRTFTENVASTVCLPFDYTPQGEGTYYTFTEINKTTSPWTVTMTSTAASLTANTPYMFMPATTGEVTFVGTASNFTYDLTGADVDDPDVTGGKWNLIGTYATKQWDGTHNTGEIGSVYGFAAQSYNPSSYTVNPGDFVKAMAGASIAPFRAYLKYTAPVSNAPRRGTAEEALPSRMTVRLVNADGDVTAIGTIDTKTGEIRFDSDAWYTLDGRRLNGKPAQKGVYINNGKKIIVK